MSQIDIAPEEGKEEIGRFGEVPFFLTQEGIQFLRTNPLYRSVGEWNEEQLAATSPEDGSDPDFKPHSTSDIRDHGTEWYFSITDGAIPSGLKYWSPVEVEKAVVTVATDMLNQVPNKANAKMVRVVLQSERFPDRFDFSRLVTDLSDFATALKTALRDAGLAATENSGAFIQDPQFKTKFQLFVDGAPFNEQGTASVVCKYRNEKRRAVNNYLGNNQ